MGNAYVFTTAPIPALTAVEFAEVGKGTMAYLKVLTHEEARRLFPHIENLPQNVSIYLVAAADGTPIALTDSWNAARGHIVHDELREVALH